MTPAEVDHAWEGNLNAGHDCEGAFALRPPVQLACVGEDDARGRRVHFRGRLSLEGPHHRDHAPFVDASRAIDNAAGQDTEIVRGLAENDDDASFGHEIGAHENGNMTIIW